MLLMTTGAALGTLVVMAAMSGARVYGKQYDRLMARSVVSAEQPAASGLKVVDVDDSVDRRPLNRRVVAGAAPDSPLLPGLTRYPQPGEAIVSPALAALIRSDARAAARFPQRIIGVLGQAGLVAPDELLAYVGVPGDDPYVVRHPPVRQVGRPPVGWTIGPGVSDALTPERGAAIGFALFVLVPFGVFLATCARLSASARDRRIAALRLLGVSARQAALVNAVETGTVAAFGALTGYGTFRLLAQVSEGWHIGRLHWFVVDATLPAPVAVLIIAAAIAFAVAVGVLATRPARVAPLRVRRNAPAGRPTWWRLGPAVCGAGLCAGAAYGDRHTAISYWAFLAGAVLIGLGIPLMLPLVTWAFAGLIRRLPVPVAWHLAAAKLSHAPGVAPRLVGALVATLYLGGLGSLGAAALLDVVDPPPVSATGARAHQVDLLRPDLAGGLTDAGGTVVLHNSVAVRVGGRPADAEVMDCRSLTAIYQLGAGESCVDGSAYRTQVWPDPAPVVEEGAEVDDVGGRWSLRAPAAVLHLSPRFGIAYSSGLLVTPASPVLRGAPSTPTSMFATIVAPDAAIAERMAQVLAQRAPAADLQGYSDVPGGVDRALVSMLLGLALAISTGLGLATYVVAAVDRAVERRRESGGLAVLGVPARVIAASEIGFAAAPLAFGVVVATGAIVAVTIALANLLGRPSPAPSDVAGAALWLGAAGLTVGIVLVAVPTVLPRRVTAESLRRE
jgi:hypothetical protein